MVGQETSVSGQETSEDSGDLTSYFPVTITVLGTAQDAGLPHIGCIKRNCELARAENRREKVAALGVRGKTGWWLLDATPDMPAQIRQMGGLPKGIFLTHAHLGHYTGLMYFGREALGAKNMPVWCSARMADFLSNNGPWEQLVKLGQIELHIFEPEQPVELEPGLSLTALQVPHRDEYSDTMGFLIQHRHVGDPALEVPRRAASSINSNHPSSLLFLPDIDQWAKWKRHLTDFLHPGAHLLLDGTFYSGAELPHRDLSEIPHPLVSQSMSALEQLPQWQSPPEKSPFKVGFIHLNHSNPLWDANSPEAVDLRRRGFFIAREGMQFNLTAGSADESAAQSAERAAKE